MISGGASTALACAAPTPVDAQAVLDNLHIDPSRKVAYREEVGHPALAQPEIATGVMGVSADGELLKQQNTPFREASLVGDGFVRVRNPPEAEANLLPIPDAFRPMLDAMRLVIAGQVKELSEQFRLELLVDAAGWTVGLRQMQAAPPAMEVSIFGCGAVLRGFEILQLDGVRRLITIERVE